MNFLKKWKNWKKFQILKTAYNDVIDVVDVDIMVSKTSKIDVFWGPPKRVQKQRFWGLWREGWQFGVVDVLLMCCWCNNDEFNDMIMLMIMIII